jgi:hypothetical protein
MRIKILAIAFLFSCLAFVLASTFHAKPVITFFPITFNSRIHTPMLTILIEGKPYQVEFDSGAQIQVKLKKDILNSIARKTPAGFSEFSDVRDNKYNTPAFLLPEVKIGNCTLTNLKVSEINETYFQNTLVFGDLDTTQSRQGVLGLDAFKNKNLLFDFA